MQDISRTNFLKVMPSTKFVGMVTAGYTRIYMTSKQTMFCIVLGIVLIVSHIIGIPLAWKEFVSVCAGMLFLGWGLYERYYKESTPPTSESVSSARDMHPTHV